MAGAAIGVGIIGPGTRRGSFMGRSSNSSLAVMARGGNQPPRGDHRSVARADDIQRLHALLAICISTSLSSLTPHHLHAPHAMAALAAGKHVEKPLAATAAEAAMVRPGAGSRGWLRAPFQNPRWDGDFLTARRLIDSGTLGEVYHFENHWPMHRPALRGVWREEPTAMLASSTTSACTLISHGDHRALRPAAERLRPGSPPAERARGPPTSSD